jgi:pimeloyl-ACP methyl ester carboxylesterase
MKGIGEAFVYLSARYHTSTGDSQLSMSDHYARTPLRRMVALISLVLASVAVLGWGAMPISSSAKATNRPAGSPAHGDFAGQIAIGGNRKLYLQCKGTGSPTVVLESGIHDSSDPWTLTDVQPPVLPSPAVFPGVARFTHVCMYDRPGTIRYTQPIALTTRSTPVRMPRTLPSIVSDLHLLLTKAGIPPPYVLVAHSMGGMILRLFAQTYPSESAALVFVEAFAPDLKPLMGADWPAYEALVNQPGTPLDTKPGFETIDIDGAISAVQQAPPLPRIPLAVMSKTEPFAFPAGVPPEIQARLEQAWPEASNQLVKLEPQIPHIFATGSDHYVQVRDPDLTISTIRLIFNRARRNK